MLSKNCTKCGKLKPLSRFSKQRSRKDGIRGKCKECISIESFERNRSKIGRIKAIYNGQISSSRRRGYPLPDYTKEEFIEWVLSHDSYNDIHNEWVDSGYKKYYSPSADRKDDYKSYTLDNLILTTWKKNFRKYNSDQKNGLNNKTSTSVDQYTIDGVFVANYHSYAEAGRVTSINKSSIEKCAKGHHSHAGNYVWKINTGLFMNKNEQAEALKLIFELSSKLETQLSWNTSLPESYKTVTKKAFSFTNGMYNKYGLGA